MPFLPLEKAYKPQHKVDSCRLSERLPPEQAAICDLDVDPRFNRTPSYIGHLFMVIEPWVRRGRAGAFRRAGRLSACNLALWITTL